MLYYKNNEWHICTEKIKYIQNGEELESYIGAEGKQWWVDLNGIEIVEFIEIEVTYDQIVRLEEVNQLNIGDGFSSILSDYVIDNNFPNGVNHLLRNLQLERENKSIKDKSNSQDMVIEELMFVILPELLGGGM